jgi:hypothetical protein
MVRARLDKRHVHAAVQVGQPPALHMDAFQRVAYFLSTIRALSNASTCARVTPNARLSRTTYP